MAIFKPLVLDKNETDIKKLMTKLYRFSQDLKFTLSDLSEDNLGKSVLDVMDKRNDRLRVIQFDSDNLEISFGNFETGVNTSLKQSMEKIELLVQKGGVVDTMLTRMELYGEYITLKSQQIIIDAQNMSLDKQGNAYFSGSVKGGSINIKNNFVVDAAGAAYVAGGMETETLNPASGIYAEDLEIFNDGEYTNMITGNIQCNDNVYIMDTLNCRRVYQTSDRRLKKDIKEIDCMKAADLVNEIQEVQFRFRENERESVGFIAQDVYGAAKKIGYPCIVAEKRGYMSIQYGSSTALYAGAIQENQRRIESLHRRIKDYGKL